MVASMQVDEDFLRQLPLPLAQLARRAYNAKIAHEKHQAAYYLWEAALKLLAATAIVEYAERPVHDPLVSKELENLVRPALGHWWKFTRLLVPVLAQTGDPGFGGVKDFLLGRRRDDLPRCAGLDVALREVLEGRADVRATVSPDQLFDHLVSYRSWVIGHGAAGLASDAFYERLGGALLAGMNELLHRLDVLAGGRLIYVEDVRRQSTGRWLVERFELRGETPRRIESLDVPASEQIQGLVPGWLYLERSADKSARLLTLHPLLAYEADDKAVLFLNSRRGKRRCEYVEYTTARVSKRENLAEEQRALLARILQVPFDVEREERLALQSVAAEEPPTDSQASPESSRYLGDFELLSQLGQGGMGVVYRAWQPSLGRQVAVKSLFRTGDEKAEARFAREIRALGRVEHPHLVRIFTSGSTAEHWFYAMELIEGASLAGVCAHLQSRLPKPDTVDGVGWQETVRTVCAEARRSEKTLVLNPKTTSGPEAPPASPGDGLPTPEPSKDYVREVVTLVRQVAWATEALHQAGIIHRDIKPGNIMVNAAANHAVLMDLGLAQIADEVEGRLTRTRQFVGTLRYASPEQLLAVGGLDARSDVYSLGATLWEMLTLRPLFGATDETPTAQLMQQIPIEEPERVRKYHPGISRDLEAIVHKCLEKAPRARYATAAELAHDLECFLAGEAVAARPVTTTERSLKWVKRHPALAALASVSVLAAMSLVGLCVGLIYNIQLRTAHQQLQNEQALRQQLHEEANKQREEFNRQQLAQVEEQRSFASRLQYGAQVKLAQSQWERTRMDEALRLLNELRPSGPSEDFRGLEWFFLHRLCQGGERSLTSGGGGVNQIAFSADGKWLAAVGNNLFGLAAPQMWDTATGHENEAFREFVGANRVAFSPAGAYLLLAIGGEIRIVDLASAQMTGALKGHTLFVSGLAFSKDGKIVASAGTDKTVRIWDIARVRELHQYPLRSGLRPRVALSPDARHLAVWDTNEEGARVLEAASGKELYAIGGKNHKVLGLAFHPDGQLLATGGEDRTVRLWNARDGQPIRSFQEPTQKVLDVAFNPDGRLLACCTGDLDHPELPGEVLVWDTASGRLEQSHRGHTALVSSVAFSPDGKRLASGSTDESVHIWNARSNAGVRSLDKHTGPVYAVAFSPDGEHLASAGEDRTIRIFGVSTASQLVAMPDSDGYISSLAYSPDGKLLATGGRDKTVKLWDARTGDAVAVWPVHRGRVTCLAFSTDSQWLASASIDGTIRVRATGSAVESNPLMGAKGAVYSVAFSPDGKILASAGEDKDVVLWHVDTKEPMARLSGHTDAVHAVCFSPDGRQLASASADGTVRVWDIANSKVVFTLRGDEEPLFSLAYSPDGQRLASAGAGRTVRLWDARTGQELLRLTGHTKTIRSVCFHRTSRLLASASEDHTVRIWDGSDRPQGDRP